MNFVAWRLCCLSRNQSSDIFSAASFILLASFVTSVPFVVLDDGNFGGCFMYVDLLMEVPVGTLLVIVRKLEYFLLLFLLWDAALLLLDISLVLLIGLLLEWQRKHRCFRHH